MKMYSWKDYKPYLPLWLSFFIAVLLFIPFAFLTSSYVNSTLYADGSASYRLTWSHYFLLLAGVLMGYLFTLWFVESVYPGRKGFWLAAVIALVAYIIGHFVGIYAFSYTGYMYGGRMYGLRSMLLLFAFVPYWAFAPGLIAGLVGAYITLFYKK